MLMNFAEEPQTPPTEPQTPPAEEPKEPGAEPAEPGNGPAEPGSVPAEPADPNKSKIEALQNSLDAALEALAKGEEPAKPTEPEPAKPAEPAPAEPAKEPEPAKPAEPAKVDPKGDAAWREEVARIRQEQEEFRNMTLKEIESMKLKDEMIGLTAEIQGVITKYPNIDPDQILREIESGSDKPVSKIAEELESNYKSLVDKISKEQEEKIRTALGKENEGRIKVPQSSGTSSTPTGTSEQTPPVSTKAAQDAAWAEATRQAKANLQ